MGAQDISVLDGINMDAAHLRGALNALQAGVFGPNDFKVVPRAAGATRSVDVGAGRAVLQSPVITQPTYHSPLYVVSQEASVNSDFFEAGGVAAPHATYSRLDQIILRLYDNEGGQRKWRPEVLTGATPTLNATLDNRHNAAALPAGVPVLRIADMVVPTSGVITSGNIRDRRPWARGVNWWAKRTAGNVSPPQAAPPGVVVDGNLAQRVECTGKPLMLWALGQGVAGAVAGFCASSVLMDGVALDGVSNFNAYFAPAAGSFGDIGFQYIATPPAGSHFFQYTAYSTVGTGIIVATVGNPLCFGIREILMPLSGNGAT